MKVDGGLFLHLDSAAETAKSLEDAGYDGVWTAEMANNPFFPLLLAAQGTEHVDLGTSIAVAFARNPMQLAVTANDLQTASKGRFVLGLGSQVEAHITRRFSMPWSSPAARMEEFISAMRAIWAAWNDGTRLDFRGEFYQHTLMTPFFTPARQEFGPPRVFLAAVGPKMTAVAARCCDGVFLHGFTTRRYFDQVTLPALRRGLAEAGRQRSEIELSIPAFVVTGETEEQMAVSADSTRRQIAFYGSTPAYRGVLEAHGWGDLAPELNRMSKEGRWAEMGTVIDDSMLGEFAVVAEPQRLAAELRGRWGDEIDRISFYAPYETRPEVWLPVIAELKSAAH
jgi:probable F420-dependent oxidoreductase